MNEKVTQREEIARKTREFLKNGGKINKVPVGATGVEVKLTDRQRKKANL